MFDVNAETIKAMLEQHFEYSRSDPDRAHAMYAEDAVLELPQSGERFVGVANMREWRRKYPAQTSFEFREVRGRDDLWITELTVRYDDGPPGFGLAIHELRGDKIVRETIYFAEGFEPPEWRASWRAAP
jgi:SnoaL-like domain